MARIDDLLAKMTLREKLGQLNMVSSGYAVTGPLLGGESPDAIRNGDIGNLLNMVGAEHVAEVQKIAVEESRLGIPLLLCFDAIHGHRTAFPVPLAEAGAFDPVLWERTARIAACEAWDDGLALTFAPMLDVARDIRWGRIVEGAGEDAWLTEQVAIAKVRGFQNGDLAASGAVAACAKHFCAYAPVAGGREYAAVDVSDRALREVYLPPFEAAVRAGAATIMPSFTNLAGVPLTAHRPLLTGWLREKLGFDGVIISDYNAVAELINHGVAGDLAEAAALALKAGVDIDMVSNAYRKHLPEALERGLVGMADIDAAVRRVLKLKERLGLFDAPHRRGTPRLAACGRDNHREVAREAARKSAVLLTNQGNTLPLRGKPKLAVVGPLAAARDEMRGPWGGAATPEDSTDLLTALRAGDLGLIVHAEGASIAGDDRSGIAAAVAAARDADAVVLVIGERANMSGEAASRAYPELPGQQRALAEALFETGKPVIVVLFAGRPLTLPWLFERAHAVLMAWFLGEQAGPAIVDLLTGKASPSGRLAMTWPRSVGQVPLHFGEYAVGRPFNAADHYTSKYIDESNSPQFPFGHGLTYGAFELTNLGADRADFGPTDVLEVKGTLTNKGSAAATETVFLFTRDPVASIARPLLELKGFAQVTLQPGASAPLSFVLPAGRLAFPDDEGKPLLEPGDFEILVGPCADREKLSKLTVRLRK